MRAASCRVVVVAVCAVYTLLRNNHLLAARLRQRRVSDRSLFNIVFGSTSSRPRWQRKYSKGLDPAQIVDTRACVRQLHRQARAQLAGVDTESTAEQPSHVLLGACHVLTRDQRTVT